MKNRTTLLSIVAVLLTLFIVVNGSILKNDNRQIKHQQVIDFQLEPNSSEALASPCPPDCPDNPSPCPPDCPDLPPLWPPQ